MKCIQENYWTGNLHISNAGTDCVGYLLSKPEIQALQQNLTGGQPFDVSQLEPDLIVGHLVLGISIALPLYASVWGARVLLSILRR